MKKSLRFLLLAAGLGLFGWFIQRTGWSDIRGTYEALGWLGLLVLIPYTIVFSIDTVGWRFTFGPTALANVPYLVTWRIRLIGEAINNTIPSMYVGGEAAKIYLLKRTGVSGLTSASAAVRSKTAQSIAQSTFIAMGAAMAAFTLSSEDAAVKWGFAGIALMGFIVMVLLFKIQKQGMVATIVRWVRKLGFKLTSASENERKFKSSIMKYTFSTIATKNISAGVPLLICWRGPLTQSRSWSWRICWGRRWRGTMPLPWRPLSALPAGSIPSCREPWAYRISA